MTRDRDDAVKMVMSVLEDGQRSDRYLRLHDGEYYTTPELTFPMDHVGPWTPPYVSIPCGYDIEEDEAEECAEALVQQIDDLHDLHY